MTNTSIGSKLKSARVEKQLTQEEAGEIFNVTRQAISSWEVGRNYPDLRMLVSLSDFYGISLDILLREDEQMVTQITNETNISKKRKIINIILVILLILITSTMFYLGKKNHEISTAVMITTSEISSISLQLDGDSINSDSKLVGNLSANKKVPLAYVSEYDHNEKTLYVSLLDIGKLSGATPINSFIFTLSDDAQLDIKKIILVSDINKTKSLKNASEQKIIYESN